MLGMASKVIVVMVPKRFVIIENIIIPSSEPTQYKTPNKVVSSSVIGPPSRGLFSDRKISNDGATQPVL